MCNVQLWLYLYTDTVRSLLVMNSFLDIFV